MADSQENFIGACVNMHIWFKPRAFIQRKMQNDQQHDIFVSDITTEQLSNANQYAHDLFWTEKHDLSCGVKQWLINVVRLAFFNVSFLVTILPHIWFYLDSFPLLSTPSSCKKLQLKLESIEQALNPTDNMDILHTLTGIKFDINTSCSYQWVVLFHIFRCEADRKEINLS